MTPDGYKVRAIVIDLGKRERLWTVGTRDAGRLREIGRIDGQTAAVPWFRVTWSNGDLEDVNGAAVTVVYYERSKPT